MFALVIPGKPTGKGRPRHGGRTFTPHATVVAEEHIRGIWRDEGSPRVDGPVKLTVKLNVSRPRSHYATSGALSATGRRFPHPHRQKPDLDNALKLIMDALNTLAWRDDVEVIEASVTRAWAPAPYTTVRVEEAAA